MKLSEAEMTETSVVLMSSVEDAEVGELDRIEAYGFGIPIFIFVERGRYVPDEADRTLHGRRQRRSGRRGLLRPTACGCSDEL